MAIEDLDGIKKELLKAFNRAVERQDGYEDDNYSSSSTPFNPAIQNRIAMGTIAQAIAAVELAQLKAEESKPFPKLEK